MPKLKKESAAASAESFTTVEVSNAGVKHFTRWICAPGNRCLPVEDQHVFQDNPNWRIFRIMAEFVEGIEFLSKLKGEVTIFGSMRALPSSHAYQVAKRLGYLLAKHGYTTITGGGPGLMEAGNWGATEGGGVSVGIDIELPVEQRRNKYVNRSIGFHYFFTRKFMLSASSEAYVFMPGGFGTLDEMTEMITLIQTGKIPMSVPVILVGKAYWKGFLEWVKQTMCDQEHYINEDEFKIIQLVDTAEEAMEIIKKTHERAFV